MNFVLEELNAYDEMIKHSNNVPQFSPYVHPIIFPIDEEKSVQVPQEIQEEAIAYWTKNKEELINPETEVLSDVETNVKNDKQNKIFDNMMIIGIVCLLIFLIYIFYGNKEIILNVE